MIWFISEGMRVVQLISGVEGERINGWGITYVSSEDDSKFRFSITLADISEAM